MTVMLASLLEKKEWIEHYLNEKGAPLSSFSFVNIFSWGDFFAFDFKIIDGCLCVFARDASGCFMYLPPLGRDFSVETVRACFDYMEKINGKRTVARIENVHRYQLSCFPSGEFRAFPKSYEYCYYRKDIAGLSGNPYKSQRAAYNQFVRGCRYHYRPYASWMRTDCEELYRRWSHQRLKKYGGDAIYRQMVEENARVHQRVLASCDDLGLVGRVVEVEGRIVAYSFGYPLTAEVFCILFEIVDLAYRGLPAFIFREFCRDPDVEAYSFINVMDDFALPNIQKTKLSFHPAVLMASYTVAKA